MYGRGATYRLRKVGVSAARSSGRKPKSDRVPVRDPSGEPRQNRSNTVAQGSAILDFVLSASSINHVYRVCVCFWASAALWSWATHHIDALRSRHDSMLQAWVFVPQGAACSVW